MEFFLYLKMLLTFFFTSFFVGTAPWAFRSKMDSRLARNLFFLLFFLVLILVSFLRLMDSRLCNCFFFYYFFRQRTLLTFFFTSFFKNGSLNLSNAKWTQG